MTTASHTILVVDDNKSIRGYCQQELQAEGYRVLLAQDGQQALDVLAHSTADLLVADIHMPRCGGMDMLRQLRQIHPTLPVIFYTSDHQAQQNHATTWPVVGWVTKCETLAPLMAAITEALSGQSPNRLNVQ